MSARGKKTFADAWTQVAFSTNYKPPLCPDDGLSRNCDILSIRHTGTKRAVGVFAQSDLPSGYIIISEPPALSCVHWKQGKRTVSEEWLKLSHKQRETMRMWFRKLQKVAHGGNDSFKSDDKKRLEKFISNYGFSDPQRDRAHIYTLGSHINHACRTCANAQYWVDSTLPNRITVRTVKSVKAGDEIFICYNKRVSYRCPLCPRMQTFSGILRTFINVVTVGRKAAPGKGQDKMVMMKVKPPKSLAYSDSEQTMSTSHLSSDPSSQFKSPRTILLST